MKLILHRTNIRRETTDGYITIDGNTICDSAEATRYMLQPGEYTLGRDSRLISHGNGVYALRALTILIGTYVVPGVVKRSAEAYKRLQQRIKKARQRGHKIILVVK